MTAALDANILLDILLPDPHFKDRSLNLLIECSKTDSLIISDIVYSELATQFEERDELEGFLHETNINLRKTSTKSLWIAAKAWGKYTKQRDDALQCNHCGQKKVYTCSKCSSIMKSRQHIISDFLIAGHAICHADRLLTRDRGFYKSYFPNLKVIYSIH